MRGTKKQNALLPLTLALQGWVLLIVFTSKPAIPKDFA